MVLLIAGVGGIVPALLWLFFWLMEDRCEPEPKRYLILTFVAGGLVVYAALQLELLAKGYFEGTSLLFVWAAIEEILKFAAAYVVALRLRVFDEPLDAVVYMTTVALGFAAFENMLFLMTPVANGEVLRTIITGDLRFIGATLLHVLSSATVGIALALAYYKGARARRLYAAGGLVLAIFLHTLFNIFILGSGSGATFWIFLCMWSGIVVLLFMIEKIKVPKRDYC